MRVGYFLVSLLFLIFLLSAPSAPLRYLASFFLCVLSLPISVTSVVILSLFLMLCLMIWCLSILPCENLNIPFAFPPPPIYNQIPWAIPSSFISTFTPISVCWTVLAKPPSLLDEASRQKMPAVAITDHGNLFAAANFFNEASKRDVKPIIGCEVYVAKGSRHDRGEKTGSPNAAPTATTAKMEPGIRGSNHLVLLCENMEGYRNLIKLVSAGFLEGFYYKPRIDYELLSKHSKGLIALSACLRGPVTECVVEEALRPGPRKRLQLRDIFGKGNFFLEIQDQGLEIEKGVNRDLIRLSKESGIPLVATNDCHYLHHEDAHAQEVLLCIQTGKTMSDTHRMKFATDQFYFKTAKEMAEVFREVPDARQPHRGYRRALQRENRALSKRSSRIQGPRWPHSRQLFRKGSSRRFCRSVFLTSNVWPQQGFLRNPAIRVRNAPVL